MMSPTIIDMPADARSAAGLSLQTATQHALSLHLDAKQAHWNMCRDQLSSGCTSFSTR